MRPGEGRGHALAGVGVVALLAFAAGTALQAKLDRTVRWALAHAYPAVDEVLIERIRFRSFCVDPGAEATPLCALHSGLETATWIALGVAGVAALLLVARRIRWARAAFRTGR